MDINIRWIGGKYTDVIFSIDNTQIEVGTLDKQEREELAQTLLQAASELTEE